MIGKYAKTVVAVLFAVAYALQAAITGDGPVEQAITTSEWIGIGLSVLAALGVYVVPNSPQPQRPPL